MITSEQYQQSAGRLTLGLMLVAGLAVVQPAAAQTVYGVAAVDKDATELRVVVPTDEARAYKLLFDGREAGAGADTLSWSLQIGSAPNAVGSTNPGPNFATYGVVGFVPAGVDPNDPNLPGTDTLSVRFNTGNSQVGTIQVDNFRLTDVTEGDRMINGGFENTPGDKGPEWRFFATSGLGVNGQYTILTDPNFVASGNQSILIERLSTDGGSGLDMWGSLSIDVIPNEELYLYATVRKDPNYAANDTRLRMAFQQFDEAGAFNGVGATNDFDVDPNGFSQIIIGPVLMDPNVVASVSAGFQVMAPGGAKGVGGYIIDDVVFSRNAPAITGNLIEQGSFENNFEGFGVSSDGSFDLSDTITIDLWRFYALGGAAGGVTPFAASASDGLLGIKLERAASDVGDTALERGSATQPTIPTAERVYRFDIDARDPADPNVGSIVRMRTFLGGAAQRDREITPSTTYATYGLTTVSDTSGKASIRFFIPRTLDEDRAVELDNVVIQDATFDVNRVTNGGFESSDTQLIEWRFFDESGTGSATLVSDPSLVFEGNNAVQLVRDDPNNSPFGLDKEGDQLLIGALPGETLTFSCMAKTVAREDAELRLGLIFFDKNGNFISGASQDFIPSELDYELLEMTRTAPDDPNLGFVNASFRFVTEAGPGGGLGTFLIDDVQLVGVNLDANPMNILPNGDFEDDPNGGTVTVMDGSNDTGVTVSEWRLFSADGATATMTLTPAAATSGSWGLEFTRDFGICRDQDVDLSGFVDFGDYAIFEGCLAGPGVTGLDATCTCLDQDGDDDLDMSDMADFQMEVNG